MTIGFSSAGVYFKVNKVCPYGIIRVRKAVSLNTKDTNPFKDLLIKILFLRAALSKDLRILEPLNKRLVWECRLLKEQYPKEFFVVINEVF